MEYKLVLDQVVVDEYNKYYFKRNTRLRKKYIDRPMHPSINTWMILPRNQMNILKQKWKEFGIWWIKRCHLDNLMLDKFEMTFITYMPTRRRIDPDNTVPKFLLDAFTEAGFIKDDDGQHLCSLTLRTGYDKDNPRTEIIIKTVDDK